MLFILVRHADAVSEGPFLPDSARHLSPQGRVQALAVGAKLRALLPARVVSSPFARALQTAELISRAAEANSQVEVWPELADASAVRQVERRLREFGQDVMVVGHEPGISALAAVLTGSARFSAFARAQALPIVDGVAQAIVLPG